MRIIDVSDPAAPVELGGHDAPNAFVKWTDVEVVGGLAYVAAGDGEGVRVFDVSNPAAVLELGGFGRALDVEVVDGLAYAADGFGLRIIDFGPEYVTEIAVDIDIKPSSDTSPINWGEAVKATK